MNYYVKYTIFFIIVVLLLSLMFMFPKYSSNKLEIKENRKLEIQNSLLEIREKQVYAMGLD